MSKKQEPWKLDDKSGSLFMMPNNEEFEQAIPSTSAPYVFMQPVDDLAAGHVLISDILKHRVASILSQSGFYFHLPSIRRMEQGFERMKAELDFWAWPKTTCLGHFNKTKEEQNEAAYFPPEPFPTSSIWNSFVSNLNDDGYDCPGIASKNRLPVFRDITEQADIVLDALPRIKQAKYSGNVPPDRAEATWRELLLGEGDAFATTHQAHIENARKNSPLTIHTSFSR